jgi:hypothetical protein
MSDYNKIISTINSVSSSYSYSPDPANLICIDSSNNRIGINTLNPTESIDISGGNVRAKDFIVLGNIIPLLDVSSNLGSSLKRWSNAYIRDISVTNIDVSGNIIPLLDVSSNLGSSLKRWSNIFVNDLSVNTINGLPYTGTVAGGSSIIVTSVNSDIIPFTSNIYSLGSAIQLWKNGYFTDISVTNIDVSGNLNPLIANRSSLGSALKYWNNAYLRDISIGNIDVSGDIIFRINTKVVTLSGNITYLELSRLSGVTSSIQTQLNSKAPTSAPTFTGTALFNGNIGASNAINPTSSNIGTLGETGFRWNSAWINNINGSAYTGTSDDRLKHNEVVIANGLTLVDKLNPKFYQKTLTMLDASYNGDLSGHIWNYESGLIAQELLQISDLSFVVSGGDYYDLSNNLITQAYGVNYNSVFVYGLAAIKELHAKVKAQETTILSLQTAMLEQKTLIDKIILAQGLNIS